MVSGSSATGETSSGARRAATLSHEIARLVEHVAQIPIAALGPGLETVVVAEVDGHAVIPEPLGEDRRDGVERGCRRPGQGQLPADLLDTAQLACPALHGSKRLSQPVQDLVPVAQEEALAEDRADDDEADRRVDHDPEREVPDGDLRGHQDQGNDRDGGQWDEVADLVRTARVGRVVVRGIGPRGCSKGQDEQADRAERRERPGARSAGQLRPAEIPDTDEGQAEEDRVRTAERARREEGEVEHRGGGEDAKDEESVHEERQVCRVLDGAGAEEGEQAGRHRRTRDRRVKVDAQLGKATEPAPQRRAIRADRADDDPAEAQVRTEPSARVHSARDPEAAPRPATPQLRRRSSRAPLGRGRSPSGARASRSRDPGSPRECGGAVARWLRARPRLLPPA